MKAQLNLAGSLLVILARALGIVLGRDHGVAKYGFRAHVNVHD
jgi:hypothetical protein